ncbi:sulfite exporter TauE/SafE family protein [Saccharopolyspora rosea]|uniref:Probable membrane transporter protein n=1 Tax=Saccharopolyspora rosea TaxID=524884 RepID=A0ABW3FSW6_9PSEU|nr:sulfite exporter TauE/SafE family protein [Saccharopolyspora rosea]
MTARTPVILGTGGVAGAVGALLGGGTGLVSVPALEKLTDLRRATIHGTTTISNAAIAAVGSTVYALRGGAVDLRVGIPLMAGGVVGAVFGARLVARAPERVLRAVFAAVLVVAGAKFLLDAAGLDPLRHPVRLGADGLPAVIVVGTLLGFVVGAWASALGLGGGLLAVPVLALLFGTGLHVAEGTSLLVMLPNSVSGALAHLRQRTAAPRVGLRLAAGAAVGAVLGAFLALALDTRVLSGIFGLVTLTVAAREMRRLRRG